MPNNDYIKRSDVLKAARYYKNRREENRVPSVDDIHLTEYQLLVQAINSIPAADVEPVRHGRWIDSMLDNFRKYECVCSECGARYIGNYDQYCEPLDFCFCPNCGAKMDGEGENAEMG